MSGDSSSIRILAVDDHQLVREGIAGFLAVQRDMTLVAEAGNGREAIQQFRTHRPDVTLIDLQMPEMNGLDALIAIRAEFHDAKIIVVTTYEGYAHIRRAVKAGAQGYLLKNTPIQIWCKPSERSMLAKGACRRRRHSRSRSMSATRRWHRPKWSCCA